MKSISSSILVLAGAILVAVGGHIPNDTQAFALIVGCGIGLIGLYGWFVSFKEQ